jgi:hypothetical protein
VLRYKHIIRHFEHKIEWTTEPTVIIKGAWRICHTLSISNLSILLDNIFFIKHLTFFSGEAYFGAIEAFGVEKTVILWRSSY